MDPAQVTGFGLAGQALILRVRFRLPKPWKPELSYLDLQRKAAETRIAAPTARQIYDWVCAIRRAKLPDPAVIGNAGSFFKNPTVTQDQCADIIAREPNIVHYPMPDGTVKLAAGWLIEQSGFAKGTRRGAVGLSTRHALALVCHEGATATALLAFADEVRDAVHARFGVLLEREPVLLGG